ncbi:hypothetical protein [Halomarina oriensis]|uniref:DUF2064 domain-containing protein n=1 Tax=Halomarina oriensis TaxID=671145 RepID=A0A6B0GQ46_9EURY|nr:hypothetical protein [Halomarina oriensis]MWG36181.1 hypothetical protein [Halomarina oriensis]
MTTVAVLCDPPREGVLSTLADTSPLTPAECADLYAAMLGDVCRAVETSGGELLVNYRGEEDAEAELRSVVREAVADPDAVRYEVQVGETFAGRAGNTATHLLDGEDVVSVAVVEPTAAFLGRSHVDNAAMKLRSSEVVVGPATRGRVYYAGFTDPVDFEDAYAAPAVETVTDRGLDAGYDVDFLPVLPVVETGSDLAEALSLIRARRRAGRIVPERTTAVLDDLGVTVVAEGADLTLAR